MIRILLVDDHRIFRESMTLLINKEPNLRVVAEASDGCSAIKLAQEMEIDLALIDISLPDLNGVEVARHLTRLPRPPKVLGLSACAREGFVDAMLASGAAGYLLKSACFEELVGAIEAVGAGRRYISPAVRQGERAVGEGGRAGNRLSDRERDVLALIAEGFTTKEIGGRLGVSPKTVSTHRTHIMEKLNLSTVAALTRYAVREHLTAGVDAASPIVPQAHAG